MEALEAILTRRSIRKFKKTPISRDMLEKLLRAAMAAPSADNAQPWHFIIVDAEELLKKVPKLNPYAAMSPEAPLNILVCANLHKVKNSNFWVQDISAAIQNLLLAAHAIGLGAVWTGIYPVPERVDGFKKLFKLPDYVVPVALIPIGYPDEYKEPEDRFDINNVHYNTWDEGY
ncbi:Nitroreductase [Desulfonauticus submarinus]|uniref:Nitroreductase n=1 Tax=Desulfonauticus submarinus TaxID=206665 RepID=A0A1G9ZIJ0_9BACT|nr:nitroreductase family protein [Desulfonauticus submarinus]SDN21272.1 Nitroreductase [Desulfonauticus submarinus]